MLYVIQRGFNMVAPTPPEDIVYCVTSVQKIIDLKLDFVFTDGHAVDGFTTQYSSADIKNVENLIDKKAIDAKYWRDDKDLDLKRRKEAEFLVLGDIAADALVGFVVYNETAEKKMLTIGVQQRKLKILTGFYF